MVAEALTRYNAAVKVNPKCARAHLNRDNNPMAHARVDQARGA